MVGSNVIHSKSQPEYDEFAYRDADAIGCPLHRHLVQEHSKHNPIKTDVGPVTKMQNPVQEALKNLFRSCEDTFRENRQLDAKLLLWVRVARCASDVPNNMM